jgi:hypothetical protein
MELMTALGVVVGSEVWSLSEERTAAGAEITGLAVLRDRVFVGTSSGELRELKISPRAFLWGGASGRGGAEARG